MVSIIERSLDTRQTLLYNEEKVSERKALLLDAYNFWQDAADLSFDDKLQRLRNLTVLNERARKTTLHFSLNFHPGDDLPDKKMKQIASLFMQKIGFAKQPYLVYRHFDAGHPHCHVVTTNVQPHGKLIPNTKLGKWQRIGICSEIERTHHLMPALDKAHLAVDKAGHDTKRVQYGKLPTKTSIAGVLNETFDAFAYTSFEDWNALLSHYRVKADRGSEQGIMYKNKGLYYRVIDENGVKVGAPIKASKFENKPTLARLETRFIENQARVLKIRQVVKTAIDWSLHQNKPPTLNTFLDSLLKKDRIKTIIQMPRSGKGRDPGKEMKEPCFFYIDLQFMTVHKDKDLGPAYTPAGIFQRSGLEQRLLTLVNDHSLQLSSHQDLSVLQDPHADPNKRLRLLLELNKQHQNWYDKIKQEEEKQVQKLQHRHRHNL